jgi:hypothetical protein
MGRRQEGVIVVERINPRTVAAQIKDNSAKTGPLKNKIGIVAILAAESTRPKREMAIMMTVLHVGSKIQQSIRITILLPAPLGPRNPKHTPSAISNSILSTALKE